VVVPASESRLGILTAGRELAGREAAAAFDPRNMDEAAMEELAESLASLRTTVRENLY